MARERHVFPTSEIPHKWAHQTQGDARNPQNNLYFKGATIYSYRDSWPLARIYYKKRGAEWHLKNSANVCLNETQRAMATDRGILVLTNSEKYGNTTAGHQSAVNRAASHLPCIAVPEVLIEGAWRGNPHERNLKHLTDLAAAELKRAQRALTEWRASSSCRISRAALEDAARYMTFFGIRRKAPAVPEAAYVAAVERARAIENPDPVRDARKIKQREQRRTKMQEALRAAFDNYSAQVATYNAALKTAFDALPAAADPATYWREHGRWPDVPHVDVPRPQYIGYKETRKFRNAGFDLPEVGYYIGGRSDRPADVLLRVDGEQIETSMGARVPLAAAPMVWLLVNREKEKGGRDLRGGLSRIKIGDYPIDRIDADGTLRAGCHVIKYDELERMARQLDLIPAAP